MELDVIWACGRFPHPINAHAAPVLTVAFDSVVVSCQAMGFGLEYLMLCGALDAAWPWERAIGRFAPTTRNGEGARRARKYPVIRCFWSR